MWSGSLLLVIIQIFKVGMVIGMKHLVPPVCNAQCPCYICWQVWEVFLVRRLLSEAVLYPVAAIEPVLSLTCLSLALIYLHTCLRLTLTFIDKFNTILTNIVREEKYTALALLSGYHMYSLGSQLYRLDSYLSAGLGARHAKLGITATFILVQGNHLTISPVSSTLSLSLMQV